MSGDRGRPQATGTGLRGAALKLFSEARRRHVVRAGLVYAGVVLIVAEVASFFLEALGLPAWTVTLVAALALLGFPVTLALAWVFDVTTEGVQKTEPAERERWGRVREAFEEALDRSPEARASYLTATGERDPVLRADVESLLRAHASEGAVDRLSRDVVEPFLEPLRSDGPHPGDEILHYRILQRLEGGGMGVVYRAHDQRLDRTVALKFLPPYLAVDGSARQRFLAEAQAAAALDHPNICTIHEIGESAGRFFIAMPFYAGRSLDGRLAQGPLPFEEALDIASQVARGLARAHESGIVHRDVKPANLVLTPPGVVKIVDFGVAKTAGPGLTQEGQIVGTAAYMSPEQARGEAVDARTDLWSLGVVLYEMVTGVQPFRGDDPRVTVHAVLTTDPAPPSTVRPELPPALDLLVRRLLEKDREARPPTAETLLEALDGLRQGGTTPSGERSQSGGVLSAEGERRQATLVVLHPTGYDELVERLPPALLEETLARRRRVAEVLLSRRGGVLNEFGGARVVAVFGVPTTHEDDAGRAVAAALELRDAWQESQEGSAGTRAGVATGLVVARPGEGPGTPFHLAGRALRTADRLASRASAGEVLLSAETHRLVAAAYATEPRDAVEMEPGDGRAVAVHAVQGPRTGPSAGGLAERAVLSSYAGRARELAALRNHLAETVHGEGRLVVVLGEAGMGKSRLLQEFLSGIDEPGVRVLRGRCQSHGGGVPYLPFVEALRDLLDIDAEGGPLDPAERVADSLASAAPLLLPSLPLYLNLLGIASEEHALPRHLRGEHFRSGIREALAAAFTLGLGEGAGVLFLEDWHWVDEASHEALEQLVEMLQGARLLVVVTCRPGYGVEWTSALPHVPLFLSPLDLDACRSVGRSVLGAQEISDGLAAVLQERAGGNPFFLEELCHSLAEEGAVTVTDGRAELGRSAGTLHLPDTVQGIIRTRLDRLDPEVRDVVRVASVIGREFSLAILSESVQPGLNPASAVEELKRVGLLRQVRVLPEPVYRFKHVLTQEVVYDTLLQHQRTALHGRVGAAIERLHRDTLEESSDRLTHHFARAEDWGRAVRYGRSWAARAEALSEFADALETLERVESWIGRLADDRYQRGLLTDVLLDQEHLCEVLGFRDRQQALIDRLVGRLEPAGDERLLGEVLRRRGDVLTLLRRFDEAALELARSLELARRVGDPMAERQALRSLGLLCWHWGRPREALRWAEEAIALDGGDDGQALVGDLTNLAQILKDLGEHERALAAIEQAMELSDRVGDALKKPYLLHIMANVYRALGDLDRAVELLERASAFTSLHRMPIQHSFHLTSIAHIHLQRGDVDEALSVYLEAVVVGRKARRADGLSHALRMAGEVLVQLDRQEEALPLLLEAITLYAQLGRPDLESPTWALVADARRRTGDTMGAVAAWTRVREMSHESGDVQGELGAVEGLAGALREAGGDPTASLPHYHDALKLARSLGDEAREGELSNTLGIIAWRAGAHHEALQHYRRALDLARSVKDPGREGLALNSIAVTLRALGRRGEAISVLEEALALHGRNGLRLLQGHALACKGDVQVDVGDLERAREAYTDSLTLRRELGDRRGEGWMLLRLAQVDERMGRGREARVLADSAAEVARQVDDPELAAGCAAVYGDPYDA